ncbi:zinc ribbon domain-containing protein [Paenibacillus daejeonensis]|uniref:zinc ribbon domain-containing protein n=1 Tax=Paenibacillus daejeonensis TaxID=135193 RepID=UPI000372F101|nr:zinc ribbon domain-containing protein [Paenibacillus daejeonensis]
MSFFNKVKQGASDAAKKAQQTVEITKMKSQISSKEKDMDKIQLKIGKAVYRAFVSGDLAESEVEVLDYCEELVLLQQDIDAIEDKIKNMKSEKTCTCGKVVPIDLKFCPECGKRFPDEPRVEDTTGDIRVICRKCSAENDIGSKYCIQCGDELSETPVT